MLSNFCFKVHANIPQTLPMMCGSKLELINPTIDLKLEMLKYFLKLP